MSGGRKCCRYRLQGLVPTNLRPLYNNAHVRVPLAPQPSAPHELRRRMSYACRARRPGPASADESATGELHDKGGGPAKAADRPEGVEIGHTSTCQQPSAGSQTADSQISRQPATHSQSASQQQPADSQQQPRSKAAPRTDPLSKTAKRKRPPTWVSGQTIDPQTC